MGIFDRRSKDAPGAASQPEDLQGDGPVTLEDRTEPGGQGSPDTNQAKTEPMSPTGTHSQPLAVPDLDDMNVGGTDPQAPRHPDALRSGPSGTGSYAHPADAPDEAHSDQAVETDVQAGAARMGPQAVGSRPGESPGQGNDQSVPSSGSSPSPGTSEEHRIVSGIRTPEGDEE